MANCHNMDALWGFMIRAGEQCRMSVPAELRDPVLWRLLKVWNLMETALDTVTDEFQQMGIFKWKGHDVQLNQVTPAMWHTTAIATRLIPRILELESKVVNTSSGSVCELMEVSLA